MQDNTSLPDPCDCTKHATKHTQPNSSAEPRLSADMQTAAKLARRGSQYFSSSGAGSSSAGDVDGVPGEHAEDGIDRPAGTPQPPTPGATGECAGGPAAGLASAAFEARLSCACQLTQRCVTTIPDPRSHVARRLP